ncbi:MAG: sulfate reduction electron transfer complex DsrMKJOP subunit DsrJ [Candidatus Kryptoniota bacterium]
MYDGGKIITGLLIFVVFFTSPFWYDISSKTALEKPNPILPANQKECVSTTSFMLSDHMELLDKWRYEVVREGKTYYTSPFGAQYKMRLTRTCLNCHSNSSEFCDKCHDYVGMTPYCWDCHNRTQSISGK